MIDKVGSKQWSFCDDKIVLMLMLKDKVDNSKGS